MKSFEYYLKSAHEMVHSGGLKNLAPSTVQDRLINYNTQYNPMIPRRKMARRVSFRAEAILASLFQVAFSSRVATFEAACGPSRVVDPVPS